MVPSQQLRIASKAAYPVAARKRVLELASELQPIQRVVARARKPLPRWNGQVRPHSRRERLGEY
jgi:hypothetical protein